MTTHKLIIAEKPSVAKEISRICGATKRQDGYMEGGGFLVSWCVGHLVSLALPESYDPKYKNRRIEDLPIFPDVWKHEVLPDTKAQYAILKKLMMRDDVESLICATDAGREGEHIFRLVYEKAGCKKPYERLWISSLEESAIREGLADLRPGKEFDNLAHAADCRSKADWLVGMNASRLFRTSVGRVQSPTLALVVNREKEIADFTPVFSYLVRLTKDGLRFDSEKSEDKDAASHLLEQVQGQPLVIEKVVTQEKPTNPPKLYNLTDLQRDANRMLGYSAKETLTTAQSLYEKKHLTYPRTDSNYLTTEMEESTKTLLAELTGHPAFPFAIAIDVPNIERVLNNEKVSDHHGLLPTLMVKTADLSKLSDKEKALLSLVTCRLLVAVGEPQLAEKTEIMASCAKIPFSANGTRIVSEGWRKTQQSLQNILKSKEQEEKEEGGIPFAVSETMELQGCTAEIAELKSSPPKPYTEDTLLLAMERAGRADYDDDSTEKKGLGTPATMADTIEGLVVRGFLNRSKRQMEATSQGTNLVQLLPASLTSPKMTAEWETELQRMAEGKADPTVFLGSVQDFVCTLVAQYDELTPEQQALVPAAGNRESLGDCPRCANPVYAGKQSYYCGKNCGFFIMEEPPFWKKAKKKITKAMVKDFLSTGKSLVKGLFSEKSGKTYDAFVLMDATGEKWVNFKLSFDGLPGKKK